MTKTCSRDVLLDAVKGFLILCIVLEHNSILTAQYDWIRSFCDAFAAGCFLILTFVWPIKKQSIYDMSNKYMAYWWTFILFITGTALLNFLLFPTDSFLSVIFNYFKATLFASPTDIKAASGFMYFWFLPCLSVLYIIRWLSEKAKLVSLFIASLAWLFIGVFEDERLTQTFFSLHVIAFIYILGFFYSYCHKPLINGDVKIRMLSIIAFLACSVASYFIGWQLFLAGGIIPSWQEPSLLLFYSIFMIVAIPGIYHLLAITPPFIRQIFAYIGKRSLIVYLFHPLVFIAFTQFFPIIEHGLLSLVFTVFVCVIIAVILEKLPMLNRFLFPRTVTSLIYNRRS
ncbi:acyltransferase family protein [Thalassotalea sediminis]|uniref:acyltransferase family protein n=1 Tax=Thalassotalea sediminis TaxID=1759089 RepID=UPI002572EE65|nr:acyltransferase family protein [Thalassotalea sediminis]